MGKKWTKEEDDFVKENCLTMTHKEIGKTLRRSELSIQRRRCRLHCAGPCGRKKDLAGQTFGKLTVIKPGTKTLNGHISWLCRCECGNKLTVASHHLISGNTQSCGCSKTVGCGEISGTYWGQVRRRAKRHSLEITISIKQAWEIYQNQKGFCALSGIKLSHRKYIGRENYISLYSKSNASLDRIDSKKGYTYNNCQWVDKHINIMKNSLPEKKFINFCHKISSHDKKK